MGERDWQPSWKTECIENGSSYSIFRVLTCDVIERKLLCLVDLPI